jgi:DNA-binding NarL/FixJ family response regulator
LLLSFFFNFNIILSKDQFLVHDLSENLAEAILEKIYYIHGNKEKKSGIYILLNGYNKYLKLHLLKNHTAMKDKLKLTKREMQLLEMFREGKTSKDCAEELHVSYFTIETHRKNIHHKLGTHKMINAVNLRTVHNY